MAIQFENFYETTLSAAITATDLYIPLENPPATATEGWLLLDWDVPASREFIYYTSKDAGGVTVTLPNRGKDGTAAVAHLKNAKVRMNVNRGLIQDILAGVNLVDGVVSTAKIAASAVTQAKIDYTSITDGPKVMPIKFTAQALGYGLSGTLFRTGNLVTLQLNGTTSSSIPQCDSTTIIETIPVGYRPTSGNIGVIVGAVTVGSVGSRLGWQVSSTGAMQQSNTNSTSGATRIHGTGTWFTDNAWPV